MPMANTSECLARSNRLLGDIRKGFGPCFATNLEKLIDATPNGRRALSLVAGNDEGHAGSNGGTASRQNQRIIRETVRSQ